MSISWFLLEDHNSHLGNRNPIQIPMRAQIPSGDGSIDMDSWINGLQLTCNSLFVDGVLG